MIRNICRMISIVLFGGMLLSTGCVSVSTESAARYGLETEEEHYWNPAEYDRVYALVRSSGWESSASAVVFDFKNDDYTIIPQSIRETKGESWVEVTRAKRLEKFLADVSDTQCRAVTIKTCLKCPRKPVGAIYTDGTLIYDCDLDTGVITFRQPLSALKDGGGGGGGAGGG